MHPCSQTDGVIHILLVHAAGRYIYSIEHRSAELCHLNVLSDLMISSGTTKLLLTLVAKFIVAHWRLRICISVILAGAWRKY